MSQTYVVRCDMLGSTGEMPYSTTIHADGVIQAMQRAQTTADSYADRLGVTRTKIRLYTADNHYLLEEA